MRTSTAAWKPILTDRLAERARDAIAAIARDLEQPPANWHPHPGLPGGSSGVALLYGYLHLETHDPDHEELAARFAEHALDSLPEASRLPGLHGGYAGVAWAIEHLQNRLFEPQNEDLNEEIDRALLDLLRVPDADVLPRDDFDLIGGLAGIGVYALERLPRPLAVACLEIVIERLDGLSCATSSGITWKTSSATLPPDKQKITPDGYYNLGVAHGVPGVIGFLAEAYTAGVQRERVARLLEGAVDWLLAQKLPAGSDSLYPDGIASGVEPRSSRPGWSYGDPGIAAVLIGAGLRAGEESWLEDGLQVARHAAVYPFERAGVVDSALLQGSSGVGHLFNRMHQGTGDPVLEQAAIFWLEETLNRRLEEGGIGGYLSYTTGPNGGLDWRADIGFLTGAAGVGLALLAATTSLEPAWDRVLLASIPGRHRA